MRENSIFRSIPLTKRKIIVVRVCIIIITIIIIVSRVYCTI